MIRQCDLDSLFLQIDFVVSDGAIISQDMKVRWIMFVSFEGWLVMMGPTSPIIINLWSELS